MSSLGGSCSEGKRSRSRRTVSIVSSTDSVVCESQTTLSGSRTVDVVDVVGAVDELDVLGCLAGGADDLLVALVADEQDVVVAVGEAHGLAVHLGDQRAGGVDGAQRQRARLLVDDRGHAVRREDDGRALGHLVGLVDEDRPALLQRGDDVLVVHDLLAHVDRRAVELEGLLDRDDGPVDTRAVAARGGEEHALRGVSHALHGRWPRSHPNPRPEPGWQCRRSAKAQVMIMLGPTAWSWRRRRHWSPGRPSPRCGPGRPDVVAPPPAVARAV